MPGLPVVKSPTRTLARVRLVSSSKGTMIPPKSNCHSTCPLIINALIFLFLFPLRMMSLTVDLGLLSSFQADANGHFPLQGLQLVHVFLRQMTDVLRHHVRLKDQDLHSVDKPRLLLPHKVHHRVHHGVRHVRRTDPSLT
ncbi:hypothetical protein F7725_013974 [Dissostichus mawsoni]|uniref:Uncharacterized protein n=1 Tax=Dissostichus mawsoni TaxID=36200 RepID=A0A7J5YV21_DISMA|nr:hypothetical protein F7725_013974 [Dissostichus mawsoni]